MKKIGWRMAAVMAMLLVAEVAGAQQAVPAAGGSQATGAASAQPDMGPVANPVTTTVKTQLGRFSKIMVAAAEAMVSRMSVVNAAMVQSRAAFIMHLQTLAPPYGAVDS